MRLPENVRTLYTNTWLNSGGIVYRFFWYQCAKPFSENIKFAKTLRAHKMHVVRNYNILKKMFEDEIKSSVKARYSALN